MKDILKEDHIKGCSYMFGPITIIMFDASEWKTLLGCSDRNFSLPMSSKQEKEDIICLQ